MSQMRVSTRKNLIAEQLRSRQPVLGKEEALRESTP
jgi:hypothetical protein